MRSLSPGKVLITGASGFIGSHLTKRLVAEGFSVHIILRQESGVDQLLDVLNEITVHRLDGNGGNLREIVENSKPDIVFHLASLFLSEHKAKDVVPLVQSNILFGSQLVEELINVGVTKFVNTGTSWQHYQNQDYNPVNLYAATKQAFAAVLQYYVESFGLSVITLKLHDTYGPNDHRPKLFNLLIRIAQTGESLDMSPGEQEVDLVYVDDVVDAYVLAARSLLFENVVGHEEYSVSSGAPMKLKDMVASFSSIFGQPVRINWGGRAYRQREVMSPWDKGEFLPGWKPEIPLAEGIRLVLSVRTKYNCQYAGE